MDVSCERILLVSQFLLSNHCTKKANPTWNDLHVATKINKGRPVQRHKIYRKMSNVLYVYVYPRNVQSNIHRLGRLQGQSWMRKTWLVRYFLSVRICLATYGHKNWAPGMVAYPCEHASAQYIDSRPQSCDNKYWRASTKHHCIVVERQSTQPAESKWACQH